MGERLKVKEARKERDAELRRNREAEAAGRQAALAELSRVREENRKLQEEVRELRCGMKGKSASLCLLFCFVYLVH